MLAIPHDLAIYSHSGSIQIESLVSMATFYHTIMMKNNALSSELLLTD